jgi:hypothetical protein
MKATLNKRGKHFYPVINISEGVTLTFRQKFLFACSALNFAKNYINQINVK